MAAGAVNDDADGFALVDRNIPILSVPLDDVLHQIECIVVDFVAQPINTMLKVGVKVDQGRVSQL